MSELCGAGTAALDCCNFSLFYNHCLSSIYTSVDLWHLGRKMAPQALGIRDLTADVLILVFSLLQGQDIARCTRYKIALAQNGMVDGHSSTLPTSERLQRLREYSSRFCDGNFDHEDLGSHPLYAQQLRDRARDRAIAREHFTSNLYSRDGRSDVSLSIFAPGSTQAGIQSSRCLLPIGTASEPGLIITEWAIDGAQDLLVLAETADIDMPELSRRRQDEFHIRFYSLSGSKTAGPTPHPDAMLPSLRSFASAAGIHDDIQPIANITELHIAGHVSVEVCNWRTGKVISRIDVGIKVVNVVPLEDPYLLIIPDASETYPESLRIYNFSPHDIPGCRVCALQLPGENLKPEEYIRSHLIYTGDRPQTSEGHFLPDLSRSVVTLTLYIEGLQVEHETHYLIVPRTILLAHMQAAESRQTLGTDSGDRVHSIPWEDWGPQGCLRLRSRHSPQWSLLRLVPFGSRFPLVVFDDADSRIASVYVFDINPLAARYQRQILAESRDDPKAEERGPTAVIDNIEEVLPGVVDPQCSSIPYAAYRFKLQYDPTEWPEGHEIRSVVMSTTGFTVEFTWVEEEKTVCRVPAALRWERTVETGVRLRQYHVLIRTRTSMDPANSDRKTSSLEIRDLTADVLVLVLSLLHGQDIARCTRVCRYFAELIRSDLSLQYKIELAQNGMVDGDSSTLPVSGRLQRLREYAYMFCNGNFDHEDLGSHPIYAQQLRGLPRKWVAVGQQLSNLYSWDRRSDMTLSVFTPGSAQAGFQSNRCLLPISRAGRQGLIIREWAIDGAQDLLVMAEIADTVGMPEEVRHRLDEFHIHLYSLNGSKSAGLIPHPAAMLPSLHLFAPAAGINDDIMPLANIVELQVAGRYIIWELTVAHGELRSVFVEVCDWRTGKVTSRIDIGTHLVYVVPLDYPYLLVLPVEPEEDPHFHIYSFSPSAIPNRHGICALRLPEERVEDDEQIDLRAIYTGDRPQTSAGHFHADLSRSMVVLQFFIEGLEGDRETHYLFPRATFLAQIRHAESRQARRADGSRAQSIPWADWGPQGCLRLSMYRQHAIHRARGIPFGSRFPLLIVDESDFRRASVYVFDINPHVARHETRVPAARQRDHSASEETDPGTSTAGNVQDIEAVLRGVVDPDCSSIPYVAYRFGLPYGPAEWQFGHRIGAVVMGMTGFTVKMAGVEFEKTEQTWTV
ncbi:hypothetical protein V8D89_005053 [Ganoderma adspersum]